MKKPNLESRSQELGDGMAEVAPTLDMRSGRSGENSFATSGGLIPEIRERKSASGNREAVMTLAIRGRGDECNLEVREDGTANAILTPNGGRGGIGCGAVAIPIQEIGKRQSGNSMNGVGHGQDGDPMFTLQSSAVHGVAIAFDEAQITSKANRTKAEPGLPASTISKDSRMMVAEVCSTVSSKWAKSSGGPSGDECQNLIATDISPTLRSGGNKTGGDRPPGTDVDTSETLIAFPARMSGTQRATSENMSPAIGAANPTAVGTTMAVRRLTPRECERLQGFPDDFTLVQFNGKPACDGPRYKAIGNSMAVPNIEWIGRRIDLVDELVPWPANV